MVAQIQQSSETFAYAYEDEGWKDKLTAYDGTPITYDAIGNVLEDGAWRYRWQIGRQLARMESAEDTLCYTYNADGLRVRKESESRGVTEYTLCGGQVVHLTRGTQAMHFWYGVGSGPVMATYNGREYGYVYNLQGDVVGLTDVADGFAEVVTYAYDAWGKPVSVTGPMAGTLGRENPFRYRGYVYDEETGFYALPARYYNPEWGRFINADAMVTRNLFAYCSNNPVMKLDRTGYYEEDMPTNTFNLDAAMRSQRSVKAIAEIAAYSASNKNNSKVTTVSQFVSEADSLAADPRESYPADVHNQGRYEHCCTTIISSCLPHGSTNTSVKSVLKNDVVVKVPLSSSGAEFAEGLVPSGAILVKPGHFAIWEGNTDYPLIQSVPSNVSIARLYEKNNSG